MYLAALILGVAGSLHCAGMCSPLALTVTNFRSSAFSNRILYNLGRITMYAILGTIVATIGYILPISKFQNLLSIALGIALIVMAIVGTTGVRIPFLSNVLIRLTGKLKNIFSRFIRRKNPAALLFIGSLNGLLPCGLTFLALSFCISLSTPFEGFIYMFFFGIGTLPVMLGATSLISFLKNKMDVNVNKVTTALMVLSGVLLIVRVFLIHIPDGHHHDFDLVNIVVCR